MKTVRYYSELIGGRALYAVCKDIKEAQAKLSEFILGVHRSSLDPASKNRLIKSASVETD